MADIELVIKIPEGLKKEFESEQWTALSCMEMKEALVHGTQLPEGHGRLIDADALETSYGLECATKYGNKSKEQQAHSYDTMMMYEIADMLDYPPSTVRSKLKRSLAKLRTALGEN